MSGAFFATYILLYFGGSFFRGHATLWNAGHPGLFDAATPLTTLFMATHLLSGAGILLLGPIQLLTRPRGTVSLLHRCAGRLYVLLAVIVGVVGLTFTLVKGTVGGPPMTFAFGISGVLILVAAERTFTYARARRTELHRTWAIRLFALAIGSWVYRMEYGLWYLAGLRHVGHTSTFTGWFDQIMNFFFYVPNLIVAEWIIRKWETIDRPARRFGAAAVLLTTSILVGVVTASVVAGRWAPRVVKALTVSAH
ncbi:hypothetical protein FHS46_000519 [Variibacter gotjawalensis]|nr:DUF2306 domain-containing protein [Variibacter gotjawalensis]NIK46202.1 hypothetical protein [Variibacter gotjawalensis]